MVDEAEAAAAEPGAWDMSLRPEQIVYRDEVMVVVDKPAGLVVHRGWADDEVALLQLVRDAVGAHVYPVHRLDRGASGVLVFALAPAVARALQEQWTAGTVSKRYLAIVRGAPPDAAEIDHPIPRSEDGPRVPAITAIRTLHRAGRYARLGARRVVVAGLMATAALSRRFSFPTGRSRRVPPLWRLASTPPPRPWRDR